MTALTMTFNQAAEAGACQTSVRRMAEHLGGIDAYGRDTPIPLTTVLDVLGVADTLWALGAIGEHRVCVAFACDCAERVLPLVTDGEARPREAIRVTRLWLAGLAGTREVERAADVAYAADAAYATAVADAAVANAAYAAHIAANAAVAYSAAYTAEAAAEAAAYAEADWRAEREWQVTRLRQYLTGQVTP